MVNINSALLSMGRYLDMPTMGVGGSHTPSYLGWMPGLTGQTAYSFGPAPDDSLGSLVGNQLPSRSYLRFGSADNYRPGGPGASAPIASLNLPPLAAPSFSQQQQAAPPQVIGGQINFNIGGGEGAEGAGQTGTIADAVKEPFKKKLAERGYDSTEADRVISAVDKASGGDQAKFKQIMSNLPPPKPVAEAGKELTDAQKRDWAEKYADWFARNVRGITKPEEVGDIKREVVPPAAPATEVEIKSAGRGKYQITGGNGTGDYVNGKYLYRKRNDWFLDAAGSPDKKVEATTVSMPRPAGKEWQYTDQQGKVHKPTSVAPKPNGRTKYTFDDKDIWLDDNDKWYNSEREGNESSWKPEQRTTPARPGKLTIGGAKSGEDIADVARLTDRLEEAIERRKKDSEDERVRKADARSRAVSAANGAIHRALGATENELKSHDDGQTLSLTSKNAGLKKKYEDELRKEIVQIAINAALQDLPRGTVITLDGTPLVVRRPWLPSPTP